MTLGQKIKAARLEKGLTQREVVGDCITRNMLSKIENDAATPSVRTLEYLAKVLDLPPGYLLEDAVSPARSVPDGLDEAREAFREQRWLDCIDILDHNKAAAASDEGYLLYARSGASAAISASKEGNLTDAHRLAEIAYYYNQKGLYYSPGLAAKLSLILGEILTKLGNEHFENRHQDIIRTLNTLDQIYQKD